jgi:hypothetical protein
MLRLKVDDMASRMKNSCNYYIELTVVVSQHGVILQPDGWAGY